MSKTEPIIPLPQPVLTNAERLRKHLPINSLAAALLGAWEDGDIADAQARMLMALEKFHAPNPTGGRHDSPAE